MSVFIFSTISKILKTTFYILWTQTCRNLKSIIFTKFLSINQEKRNDWLKFLWVAYTCIKIYDLKFLNLQFYLKTIVSKRCWIVFKTFQSYKFVSMKRKTNLYELKKHKNNSTKKWFRWSMIKLPIQMSTTQLIKNILNLQF